jgi:tRNA (guanine-N7-)-methyltransferase
VRASRRLPLEALEPYLLDVPHPGVLPPDSPAFAPAPPIDWSALFGNDRPVEIEVGSGKGLFLLTQGPARPDTNFLGIEIERKYTLLTATRIARRQLPNVKLACTDARWFMKERVAEASVSALHVYFPDPWWKTRHRKRKLFTRDFSERCVRVLQYLGRLHFATDVADYFAETLEMLNGIAALRVLPPPANDAEDLTNFERKYRREGRAIYRALYEKNSPLSPCGRGAGGEGLPDPQAPPPHP